MTAGKTKQQPHPAGTFSKFPQPPRFFAHLFLPMDCFSVSSTPWPKARSRRVAVSFVPCFSRHAGNSSGLCLPGRQSIMQNKPNSQNQKITANPLLSKIYTNITLRPARKNKPKQTQFVAAKPLAKSQIRRGGPDPGAPPKNIPPASRGCLSVVCPLSSVVWRPPTSHIRHTKTIPIPSRLPARQAGLSFRGKTPMAANGAFQV